MNTNRFEPSYLDAGTLDTTPTIILAGPQGVGKGEQGKLLVQNLGYEKPFVLGDELRARRSQTVQTPQGERTIGEIQDSGALVENYIVMPIAAEHMRVQGATQKLIFDGIPRNLGQADDFNAELQTAGRLDDTRMVFIDAPRPVVEGNIAFRAVQQGRSDDANANTVSRRLNTFYADTMPVVQHYADMKKLIRVSGDTGFDSKRATDVLQRLRILKSKVELNGDAQEFADLQGEWSEIELTMAASINEVHMRVVEALKADRVGDPKAVHDDSARFAALRNAVLLGKA